MNKAVRANALDGFRLELKFADGTEGMVDLSDLAGRGVFGAWSERRIFQAVTISESGAVAWPGEIELCPDALYLRLTGKQVDEIF